MRESWMRFGRNGRTLLIGSALILVVAVPALLFPAWDRRALRRLRPYVACAPETTARDTRLID